MQEPEPTKPAHAQPPSEPSAAAMPPSPPVMLDYHSSPPKSRNLRVIAEQQRLMSWCGILYLFFFSILVITSNIRQEDFSIFDLGGLPLAGAVITALLACISAWRLCLGVYSTRAGIAMGLFITIFLVIPYVAVVPVALVHSRTKALLRQHGLKVGIMGADLEQLSQMPW